MNLFLLRHAKAHPRGEHFKLDSKRTLTREGEEVMQGAAEGMKALEVSFDLILTSPYVRAARTAEITARVFKSEKVWVTENLTPDANAKRLVAEINENYTAARNILLVGHEPFLSQFMSVLLSGDSGLSIDFKKSALAKLSTRDLRHGPCATLEWFLTPRQLQRLGGK